MNELIRTAIEEAYFKTIDMRATLLKDQEAVTKEEYSRLQRLLKALVIECTYKSDDCLT